MAKTTNTAKVPRKEGEMAKATFPKGTAVSEIPGIGSMWSENTVLTPEMAERLISQHNFKNQRPVKDLHVQFLCGEIERDAFSPSQMTIAHIGGESYLINGQHRCWAVFTTGKDIFVTISHISTNDMKVVEKLYAETDIGSTRTIADSLRATGIRDNCGVLPSDLSRFSGAITTLMSGFERNQRISTITKSRSLRNKAVQMYAPFFSMYVEDVSGCARGFRTAMLRGPVSAVAIATYQDAPVPAKEFWTSLAHNDGLKPGDPRHTLFNFLINPLGNASEYLYARYVSKAWCLWYEHKTITRLFPQDSARPILIAGTRYDGENVLDYKSQLGVED